ncbi:MAG: hypothetical protein K2X52_29670 [Mycobacteriaceae bacterium]|nr:hypothetical protein [Mycobacteriaceae bacterium]
MGIGVLGIDGMFGIEGMPSIMLLIFSCMAAQHRMPPSMDAQQLGFAKSKYKPAAMTKTPTAMPVTARAG